MKKIIFVDANIIVHHLLGDHPTLSPQAKKLFIRAQSGKIQLYFDEVIIAEVVWVLKSFYKIAKEDICQQLLDIITQEWVINPKKRLMIKSLEQFKITNLSYIDCWVLNVSKHKKLQLQTFDKALLRHCG